MSRCFLTGLELNTGRLWKQGLVAAVLLCGSSWLAAAPAVTVDVPLEFGLLAVKSNISSSTLQVAPSGAISFSGDILAIGGAFRGEYRVTGFPPNTPLEVTVDDASLSAGGGGLPELLTVTDYDSPSVVTDALGEALVLLGASLKTNASGVMYVDAPYSGLALMRIRYWSAPDSNYLTHNESVSFAAELQSTINLVENQALAFGTVAAYTDPAFKASLTLATNGSVNVASAGSARITSLGGAKVAVIQVAGGAPYATVTITPEAGSVFLAHTTLGTAAARFIAKSFITNPSGTGVLDSSGNLDILLGATLETEVTTKTYVEGNYSGVYSLIVSY